MAQVQLDYPPLTLTELGELLIRHADNAAVAKVIKDAMQRRLAETERANEDYETGCGS